MNQLFKIKINRVNNLIKVLDLLKTGNTHVHKIHEYKYLDTNYEMKYGYDLILDSVNAKNEKKARQLLENANKRQQKELN